MALIPTPLEDMCQCCYLPTTLSPLLLQRLWLVGAALEPPQIATAAAAAAAVVVVAAAVVVLIAMPGRERRRAQRRNQMC